MNKIKNAGMFVYTKNSFLVYRTLIRKTQNNTALKIKSNYLIPFIQLEIML